ncbi:MAG: HAD family hydrolase [Acutalibacteraceae bacterium]|nr:HAD family hydrolase [Acutalibacteraceae bacterium]
MKRLYVTDLDGTLLNKESHLSEKSKEILNTFILNGGMFTYATARSYNSAKYVTEGLNITVPIIMYNGAFIYDIPSEKYIYSVLFNQYQLNEIIKLTNQFKYTPLVYTFINGEEKILWDKSGNLSEGFLYYLSNRKNDKRIIPVENISQSFCGDIFYITFIEDYEKLFPLYNAIKENELFNSVFQQEIYRTEYWCEIMPKSANKANAIKKLKKMLECDELVVFGDSLNDIPMFEIADKSYAVMNANDRLKQIATETIGYNYEDSVVLKLLEIENN